MMKKLLLSSCILITLTVHSQLIVSTEDNNEVFVYSLAGPGIVVSDVVRTCGEDGSGFFNSLDANVGIENGMILTSGSITNAQGPNNAGSISGYLGTTGDDDLTEAAGINTYDACVIEFNMTVMADTLRLDYVFASEEYLEYAGSAFNDVFAFYLSGPGIEEPINIALVPGTELPVAINNVNDVTNPAYYINNGDGFTEPYSTDDFYIQYDGMTTVLEAYALVTAGETYHMKIAIADAGDGVLDSGVFLETGSLGSLRMAHNVSIDMDAEFAVEKCASGHFNFINEVPSDLPLVLDYYIAGSATNGVDYETIPEQLIIPAGESTGAIEITPLHDAEFEGLESVILYLYNPQSGFIYDTVTLFIDDELQLSSFETIADDLTIQFSEASGVATSWAWDFGDGNTSTEQNPLHTYETAGEYNVCLAITDAVGCEDEFCKTVSAGTVGIETPESTDFSISPNPVSDNLTIQLNGNVTGQFITVKNIVGQTIISEIANNNSMVIDMSSSPKGIYFVEVRDGEDYSVVQIEKL